LGDIFFIPRILNLGTKCIEQPASRPGRFSSGKKTPVLTE